MQHRTGQARLLHLTLPNHESALETARQALLDFLSSRAIPSRALYRLELVLEETLMNLIWHAFPEGGEHDIEVSAELQTDHVVLRFTDDGVAFDPLQQAIAARPASLDEAVPGGLGLLLTRKAVREARYERVGNLNCLTLRIALTS